MSPYSRSHEILMYVMRYHIIFHFLSDNVALQPRTKGKVRVSPKGWRTVFDFPSAKLWRKIDPRNTQKL